MVMRRERDATTTRTKQHATKHDLAFAVHSRDEASHFTDLERGKSGDV